MTWKRTTIPTCAHTPAVRRLLKHTCSFSSVSGLLNVRDAVIFSACKCDGTVGYEAISLDWMLFSGERSTRAPLTTRVQMPFCLLGAMFGFFVLPFFFPLPCLLAELACPAHCVTIRCLDEECVLSSPAWALYHSSVYSQLNAEDSARSCSRTELNGVRSSPNYFCEVFTRTSVFEMDSIFFGKCWSGWRLKCFCSGAKPRWVIRFWRRNYMFAKWRRDV